MGIEENKRLVQQMVTFEGNWFKLFADDAVWIIPGTTRFSGTFRGTQEITEKLLGPLGSELGSFGSQKIENLIAEGDYVVAQTQVSGRVTKAGKPYNNTYCMVFKIIDGKIQELTEYADTELVTAVFGK